MSIIEHPKVSYEDISSLRKDKYSMVAEMIHTPYNELAEKKCCDNCEYFDTFSEFEIRAEDGMCLKNVANDEFGVYIEDSDTFYCSYHKFKV